MEDVRLVLEEQAGLRRLAQLVARGVERMEVFAAVTEEVGRLLDVELANLVRYEDDGTGLVVGAWSKNIATAPAPVGLVVPLDDESVTAMVNRSKRASRLDTYEGKGGRLAEFERQGYRAAIGAPVMFDGRVWGAVMAASTQPAPFPPGTEDRLAGFAELVAQALANAEARDQLLASRARIVAAADAERLRLERNLHDGAQQRLITVSLMLRVAERELERDPAQARERIGAAISELAHAHAELREIARGLHPATLTDRGLGPAIEALAQRATVPVTVALDTDLDVPEPLKVAAYYLVSESLTNVAKYADATSAAITVRRADGRLLVEVTDDGAGGADPARGTGLRGLTDRVEALGGRLAVRSPVGAGTTVLAELPER